VQTPKETPNGEPRMSRSAPTDIDIGRHYTPQPVQRKFHASEARYPLLEGGRGGGKNERNCGKNTKHY
jgi:hypothetical protein